jgi:hypothetical protein
VIDMADDKPKIDFDNIGAALKKNAKQEHIDDILERLTDAYSAHKKSIKNKRKLTVDEAKQLSDKLYDEMGSYIADYYKLGKNAGIIKGAKGEHGEPLFDTVVSHHFNLTRQQLRDNLMHDAEAGQSFSKRYLQEVFKPHMEHYHGTKTAAIVRDINLKDKGALQKKISDYLAQNPGIDKDQYKPTLKPEAEFNEVRQRYIGIAGQYHKAA